MIHSIFSLAESGKLKTGTVPIADRSYDLNGTRAKPTTPGIDRSLIAGITRKEIKMQPKNMIRIIGRKRYNTQTSLLICGDDYWDGNNYERRGTNTFLFLAGNGDYFFQHLTQWQGSHDTLEVVSQDAALEFYGQCQNWDTCRVDDETAFPNIDIWDTEKPIVTTDEFIKRMRRCEALEDLVNLLNGVYIDSSVCPLLPNFGGEKPTVDENTIILSWDESRMAIHDMKNSAAIIVPRK